MKRIIDNYPRLKNFYDIGPVQRAELESFLADFLALGSALTADSKFVKAGDKVWVISSTGIPKETTVQPLKHLTSYELFGPVSVSSSFSSKTAAIRYLKDAHDCT
jgi:hypothetical protein